jgi:SAM-dependent methyltransferase
VIGQVFTPARRRGLEILDDPAVDPALRRRSIADVAVSNKLLGGLRAPLGELRRFFSDAGSELTLLDVGTGFADIPANAARLARDAGVALTTIGVDTSHELLVADRNRISHAVCADALRLPFPDRAVDVVMCSQLLHHFEMADAASVLAELNRVARLAVIVSDLRRSWVAVAGFWMATFPLRFHAITRHDGVVSILRGFTRHELESLIAMSTGAHPTVRHRLGYRITASWRTV